MAVPKQSPDKGKSVAWYIDEKVADGWQKLAMVDLHNLILQIEPAATHTIKWAQPVYESPDGPIVFMKSNKNHITFGFWRGTELQDPKGLLEGTGGKMRHIKIKSAETIDREAITEFVKEAIKLNEEHGNPTR